MDNAKKRKRKKKKHEIAWVETPAVFGVAGLLRGSASPSICHSNRDEWSVVVGDCIYICAVLWRFRYGECCEGR